MAQVLVTESYLDNIADAIRTQNGSEDTYTPAEMAGAIENLYPEPSGSISITQNGTVDVKSKASAEVAVPNSYSASDEGKVVSSGALVSQSSAKKTANGTYDTTLNNEVVVDVPSPTLIQKSITANGTYYAQDDISDGYSSVIVNVSGGGQQVSDNDLLFHFNDGFGNSGKISAAFNNAKGMEISNEQSKFGGKSLKLGTTQKVKNVTLDPSFDFESNDFTLDFWIYPTSLSTGSDQVPISFEYRSLAIYLRKNSILLGVAKTNNSWIIANTTSNINIEVNQWHHIAVVRNEATVYLFLNGEKLQENNFGNDAIAPQKVMTIGSNSYSEGSGRFSGYIDELRVKIGHAVWTSDFTPPIQPYT